MEGFKKVSHRKRISRVRKTTGEKDLFLSIWDSRPHVCTNCGKYLGEEPRAHYFSHIKSKGAYPELRLDPNNCQLLCMECHFAFDFQGIDEFNKLRKK